MKHILEIILRKIVFIVAMMFSFGTLTAQNLVPNGDFEMYDTCPNNVGQLSRATYWMNPFYQNTFPGGSPEYFNACDTVPWMVGVPSNYRGYQLARSGSAYAGLVTYCNPLLNFREHIEVSLTKKLVAGLCYHFEMYFNVADFSAYSSDAIGVYFSDTAILNLVNFNSMQITPDIENVHGNFPDTLNWTLVSGNYIAKGTEKFLLIGNFRKDNATDTVRLKPNATAYLYSYILLDDVSLTQAECPNSINDISLSKITLYPNHATDFVTISAEENIESVEIYDVTGNRLLVETLNSKSASLFVGRLNRGFYFCRISCRNEQETKVFVVE